MPFSYPAAFGTAHTSGSTTTVAGGSLGTNVLTYTITPSTSGCWGWGIRYKNTENGFEVKAGCTATSTNPFSASTPVLSNGNKTVTLTAANQSVSGCVNLATLGTARTWSNITLTMTITSNLPNQVWTVNTTTGDISCPITNRAGSPGNLTVTVSETATWSQTGGSAATQTNVQANIPALPNIFQGCGTGTLLSCSHLVTGYFQYTPTTLAASAAAAICTGGTINLNVTTSGAVPANSNGTTETWLWSSPSSGSYSATNIQNPTVTGAAVGSPTYKVDYTDDNNCVSTQATATATVANKPVAPAAPTAVANILCNGTSTTLTVAAPSQGVAGTYTYQWQKMATNCTTPSNRGTNSTSYVTPNMTNGTSAPLDSFYNVYITSSASGCDAVSSPCKAITVNPVATVTPSPTSQSKCPGIATTAITFTCGNCTGGTVAYNWTNTNTAINLAASGAGTIASFSPTNTGNANIAGTIATTPAYTNSSGGPVCNGTPTNATITVYPKPTVAMTPSSQGPSCSPDLLTTIVFTNPNGVPGTTNYTWSRDKTTELTGIAASQGPGVLPGINISGTLTNTTNATQTTTFTGYATSANGCLSTNATSTVTVYPKPDTPMVNGSSTDFTISFCGTGQLVSTIVRNDTTVKYFDSVATTLLGTGSVYNVTTPGLYKVMTYNNTTGCYSDTVRVRVFLTPPFSTTVTKSNFNGYGVSCNGGSNGSITVAASTTAYPVIYTWSTGRTRTINSGAVRDSIIGTLAAGTYYISMSDASGCGKVDTVVLTAPPALALSLTPSSFNGFGTSCNGSSTGSITATPSGGYGTYGYSWTSTPPVYTSTSGNISGLAQKTYNLTVTDGNSCTITGSASITDPSVITFTYSIGYACSGSTYTSAAVTINASGGASGNYEYKMDAGAWQSSNLFSGLANSSNHTFQVRDASYTSCLSATQNFTITFPANGTSVGDCNFIYVTTGGDPSGTLGSKACPVTLRAAFSIYAGNNVRNHILMESGAYTSDSITIPGGVVIDGGYNSSTWIKSTATATTINITNPALIANAGEGHYTGIILGGNNITLKDLTINVKTGGASGTTASRGRSIYGIYSNGRTGFLISRCAISTGAASAGANGATHTGSGGGGAGGLGGRNANGYAYGCSSCGTNGDNGDNAPGYGGGYGAGGAGGARCCASGCNWYGCDANGCNNGNTGGNGQPGAPGANGAVAAANTTGLGVFYTPVDGNDGTDGKGGGGGGRGGEGASGTCCTCTCGPNFGTGGRGGDGGNGGLGGYKGYGGGSSFDIYVYGGSGTVTDCFGSAGAFGGGGSGSNGQQPTNGSGGGAPGDNSGWCDGGRGAWGGAGGNGGIGGNGTGGANGISARLQTVNGASVTGSGISASAVPVDGTVTVDWKRGCTNSQIDITKSSGSAWTGISSNPAFVLNKDSASTSFGTASPAPSIYYTTTGVKNLSLGSTTLSNFITIYDTRLVTPATSVMNAISPNMICPTASISLGTSLTAPQIANITEWSWEISKVNDPFTNVYTSTSSAPGTVTAPSGGWEPGELYQIRLEMKELCCGWSIPIYRTFRIYPVLAQPTITAVPSGTVCQNSTIKYYTAVSGATTYSWTVTGGTVVPGVTSDTIYVTWPTATTGTVSVVPKNACTPNTDGPVRTINVTVNAIPSVSVTNSNPDICRPGSTTLTALAGSGGGAGNGSFSYLWSPGSSTANPLTFTPSAAGTYTYTVQVTEGGSGCKVVSPVITITADDAPDATPALTKLYACDPSAVLTASSITSGASIFWHLLSGTGTPSSSTSNPVTITGLTSGATTVYELLISKGNCDSLNTGNVSITAPSAGTTTIATTSSCDYCVISDGSTKSFYNNLGHILATITDDPATTPAKLDTTEVCVGMMAYTATTVPTVYTSFGDYQPYLPRRWSVKPVNNTKSHVILYFKAAEVNALQTAAIGTDYQFSNPTSELVITKFNGGTAGTFTNPPVYPATNNSAVLIFPVVKKYPSITTGPDYSVEFDVTNFSTFYLHPNQFPFAPLPVELISFTGWNQGRVNQLQWSTASEQNTLRFEIEKSTNAVSWVMIGSKPAAGNSSQVITYDFTDNNPVVGFNYYRLKIIDIDGKISYSKIIDINLTDVVINGFVNIYPNPTTGNLNVDIQSTGTYTTTILVYDVLGSVLSEQPILLKRGLNSLQLDFSSLSKGTYMLKYADTNGKTHTEEFVKN